MKFSAQEEYGLRCLLQIGRQAEKGSLTIPEISSAEGLSAPYVAKLMRVLRQGGFVQSTRGQAGGYVLSRPPEQIVIGEVLALLGGRFYEPEFCERYPGNEEICTHTVDCSVRSLWSAVQGVIDRVLSKTTLQDLLGNEQETFSSVSNLVQLEEIPTRPPIC
ncbi:MAG: Rrf2 family transcriptional regulator [Acidobacteria bacterium]|nr:Rrf2 family transcriptional regulator [Acidobacteriota bacterium]